MAFFDAPPPMPDAPKPTALLPWFGPPQGVIGGSDPQQLVIARTDNVAIAVTELTAYPLGFTFNLTFLGRSENVELPPVTPYYRPRHGEGLENQFRFGLLLSDSTKVIASQTRAVPGSSDWNSFAALERPPEPMLRINGGGGGSGNKWDWRYWNTPLPPPGPLAFVVQWLAVRIMETSTPSMRWSFSTLPSQRPQSGPTNSPFGCRRSFTTRDP